MTILIGYFGREQFSTFSNFEHANNKNLIVFAAIVIDIEFKAVLGRAVAEFGRFWSSRDMLR